LSIEEKRFSIISKKTDQMVERLNDVDLITEEGRKEYKNLMDSIIKSQAMYETYKKAMMTDHRVRKIKGNNRLSVREQKQLERKIDNYVD
jgi:hypothetical protein